MNIKVIKKPIPAEICEDGGASVIIIGKETVDLETSIDEAKDVLIVVGDKLLVKGMFVGLFKSMVKGIERDGNARQLGDFITLYPVPTGEFDLDKGWQAGVNGVRIRARLMNELELDISNWEFEDVTPGREAFTLGSVECGNRQLGVVDFVHPVWINGKPLPRTDEIRIDWAVEGTDRHGTIAAAKVTSTASRATIAADALAELASEEYDGKKIVFTVRGNFASAKIAATLRYAVPPGPKRHVEVSGYSASSDNGHTTVQFHLENAADLAGYSYDAEMSSASASFKADGEPVGDGTIVGNDGEWHAIFTADTAGKTLEMTLTPDPAKAAEVDQTPVVVSTTVEG